MPANLLLLDEPTNHLDIPAREALEAFLRETTATILLVSHDRRLLETVCDRLWVVDDARIVPFEAGYRSWRAAAADGWRAGEAYLREQERFHGRGAGAGSGPAGRTTGRAAATAAGTAGGSREAATPPGSPSTSPSQVRAPRQPKLSKDAFRRQKAVIEDDLGRLGLRKGHLELALMNPTTSANFVELRRVTSELADVDQALAAAEEAWLLLEERAP